MCRKNIAAVSGHPGITFDILVVLKAKLSLMHFPSSPTHPPAIFVALWLFGPESAHMQRFIVILSFQFHVVLLHAAHLFLKGELNWLNLCHCIVGTSSLDWLQPVFFVPQKWGGKVCVPVRNRDLAAVPVYSLALPLLGRGQYCCNAPLLLCMALALHDVGAACELAPELLLWEDTSFSMI